MSHEVYQLLRKNSWLFLLSVLLTIHSVITATTDILIFTETHTQKIFIYNVDRGPARLSGAKVLEHSLVGRVSCLDAAIVPTKTLNTNGTPVFQDIPFIFYASNHEGLIVKRQLDGWQYTVLRSFRPEEARIASISVDAYSGLIYYANNALNTINVMNINGLYHKTLIQLSNVTKVQSLTVDPLKGLMFWTSLGPKPSIQRANMDGTDQKTIIDSDILSPWGLTLSEENSRICWGDRKTYKIEIAAYDGTERRVIIDSKFNPKSRMVQPYSLTFQGRRLFWSDWMTGKIMTAKFGIDYTRNPQELLEADEVMNEIFDRPGSITCLVKPALPSTHYMYKYPCSSLKVDGALCQELCIPVPLPNSPDSSPSTWWKELATVKKCACQDNIEINSQGRCLIPGSASEIVQWNPLEDEIMFVSDTSFGKIMTIGLDQSKSQSYFTLPTTSTSATTAFDYDPLNKTFYWIDRYTVPPSTPNYSTIAYPIILPNNNYYQKAFMAKYLSIKAIDITATTHSEARVIKKFNGQASEPTALAIDYISRLIYFSDNLLLTISVMDMKEYKDKVLITELPSPAISLALAPEDGLIFWVEQGKDSRIMSAWSDGSHIKVLVEDKFDMPFELCVDHQAKMLYWTDTWHNAIQRMSFDGTHRSIIIKGPSSLGSLAKTNKKFEGKDTIFQPLGLALDSNTLYWTDGVTNAMYALPKSVIALDSSNDFNDNQFDIAQANPLWGSIYKVGPQVFRRPYRVKLGWSGSKLDANRQLDNACSLGRMGDCSHLCLPLPGQTKVCECPHGMMKKGTGSAILCSYGENEFNSTYHLVKYHEFRQSNGKLMINPHTVPFLYFVDPIEPSLMVMNLDDPDISFNMFQSFLEFDDHNSSSLVSGLNLISSLRKFVRPIPISVDYDHYGGKFYFVDTLDNSIKAMHISKSSIQPVAKFSLSTAISSIYVDPYTDLIYYIDSGNNILGQLTKDGRLQRDILRLSNSQITSLQIDSFNGYIYWAQMDEEGGMIKKSHMDGSYPRTLLKDAVKYPSSLTLDVLGNRLYWLDLIQNTVGSCDVYGKGAGTLLIFETQYLKPRSLTLSSTHLYWSDLSRTNIFNLSKDYLEVHRISEYGITPRYVTLADKYLSQKEENSIPKIKYAPEQTLKVGAEVQVMPSIGFLSMSSLRVFNESLTKEIMSHKPGYKPCPKLGPRQHGNRSLRRHASQRYGGCSDFCYPLPDSDLSRVCGCADQEGTPIKLFENPDKSLSEATETFEYYHYYGTQLAQTNRLAGRNYVSHMGTSVLLDDKLTCNRSLICPSHGKNREDAGPHDGLLMTTCQTGTSVGDKCSFECLSGYISVSGLITRECQEDGKWSGELLKCQAIKCDELESPSNSKIITCSGFYNTSCQFECKDDAVYVSGNLVRKCLETGTWSGTPLICKRKTCPFPPPLLSENPHILIKECITPSTKGATCRLGCKGQNSLETLLTCLDDGTWSQPDYSIFTCYKNITSVDEIKTKYRCSYPLLDASYNGVVKACPPNPKPGDICHFLCRYPLVPYSGSSSSICLDDGTWSQPYLKCRAISCQAPPSPYNSLQISCNDPNYLVDSRCRYKCNPGFHKLGGETSRQCLVTGTWSGEELLCSECPPLPQPSMGVLECSLNGQTVSCRVKCDKGMVLIDKHAIDHLKLEVDTSSIFVCDRARKTWLPQRQNVPSCSVLVPPSFLALKGTLTITKKIPESVAAQQSCSSINGYDSLDNDLHMPSLLDSDLFDKCASLERFRCVGRQTLVERRCLTQDKYALNFAEAKRLTYNTYPKYFQHVYNFSLFVNNKNDTEVNLMMYGSDQDEASLGEDPLEIIASLVQINDKFVNADEGTFDVKESSYNLTCPPGHIVVGQACAGCPEGTRKALELDFCIPCEPGFYQDMYAQDHCKPCPHNQISYMHGSYHCDSTLYDLQKSEYVGNDKNKYVIGILFMVLILTLGICLIYQKPIRNWCNGKKGRNDVTTTNNHQPFGNGIENETSSGGSTNVANAWNKLGFRHTVKQTVIKMKNYRNNDTTTSQPEESVSTLPYEKFKHSK